MFNPYSRARRFAGVERFLKIHAGIDEQHGNRQAGSVRIIWQTMLPARCIADNTATST